MTDLTFRVERGQTVGIIGGQAQEIFLVNLIPRFYDATAGQVKVFGEEIKEYDVESLRSRIGVVLQKAVLFKGRSRKTSGGAMKMPRKRSWKRR